MTTIACALALVLSLTPGVQPIGEVETHIDKTADFKAFRTYTWRAGHEAFDRNAHNTIVSTIDAKMAGLGLKRVESGGDLILAYYTLRSSEVDLKALQKLEKQGKDPAGATLPIGRLAIVLSLPDWKTTVWSAATRRRINDDPAKRIDDLTRGVDAIFATYPGSKGAAK